MTMPRRRGLMSKGQLLDEIERLTVAYAAREAALVMLRGRCATAEARVARVEAAMEVLDEVAYYQLGVEQALTTSQTGQCRAQVPPHWKDEASDRARPYRVHFRAALDGAA